MTTSTGPLDEYPIRARRGLVRNHETLFAALSGVLPPRDITHPVWTALSVDALTDFQVASVYRAIR
jgi:hypothetical protein